MQKNISIQDIANKLEISRNTVSKALNGKYVPKKTLQDVLQCAKELGYKGMNLINNNDDENSNLNGQKILILTAKMIFDVSFHINILRGIESMLSKNSMQVISYTTTNTTDCDGLLSYIEQFDVKGIICIEFFDASMIDAILSLKIPTIFLDFTCDNIAFHDGYDILMMENIQPVRELCNSMIKNKGCKTFGFVGDYKHCLSFYERFLALKDSLFENNIDYNKNYSLLLEDSFPYGNPLELCKELKKITLPDCLVCANDFLAISTLHALSKLGIYAPNDIKIIGFDNIPESKMCKPQLSTIKVNKTALGADAVNYLINRIKDPKQHKRLIYVESKILERETT